jgi:hypothetical protein
MNIVPNAADALAINSPRRPALSDRSVPTDDRDRRREGLDVPLVRRWRPDDLEQASMSVSWRDFLNKDRQYPPGLVAERSLHGRQVNRSGVAFE